MINISIHNFVFWKMSYREDTIDLSDKSASVSIWKETHEKQKQLFEYIITDLLCFSTYEESILYEKTWVVFSSKNNPVTNTHNHFIAIWPT